MKTRNKMLRALSTTYPVAFIDNSVSIDFTDMTLRLRPYVNFEEVKKNIVPDYVSVGIYGGYSLPIYNSDFEEIKLNHRIPCRWDEENLVVLEYVVALSGNEVVGKKFKILLSWQTVSTSGVVNTNGTDVIVETTIVTDRNLQDSLYNIRFSMDLYGASADCNDVLGMRVRRVAASGNEIAGEIILIDPSVVYPVSKIFATVH